MVCLDLQRRVIDERGLGIVSSHGTGNRSREVFGRQLSS